MVMRIGPLRHRLTIEEYEVLSNDIGVESRQWKTLETVWGSIEVLTGKEYISPLGTKEEISVKITVRYFKELNSKMRITFKDRIFKIEGIINPEERNIMLILLCSETKGSD